MQYFLQILKVYFVHKGFRGNLKGKRGGGINIFLNFFILIDFKWEICKFCQKCTKPLIKI